MPAAHTLHRPQTRRAAAPEKPSVETRDVVSLMAIAFGVVITPAWMYALWLFADRLISAIF